MGLVLYPFLFLLHISQLQHASLVMKAQWLSYHAWAHDSRVTRSCLCSKPWVSLWPLAENSPVCEMMRSIASIDTSKDCFWPLKTGLILAAAQHIPPGVQWSMSSGIWERDCGAAFPNPELEPNFWAAGLSCASHAVLWHNRMLLQLEHFGNPVNDVAPRGVTSTQLTGWNLLHLAQLWRKYIL